LSLHEDLSKDAKLYAVMKNFNYQR